MQIILIQKILMQIIVYSHADNLFILMQTRREFFEDFCSVT